MKGWMLAKSSGDMVPFICSPDQSVFPTSPCAPDALRFSPYQERDYGDNIEYWALQKT
jgi:hypothetical protein